MSSLGKKQRIGVNLGWLSISLNVILAAIKFVIGYLTSSIAIISDAFHSLSDVVTSVLVIVSFKFSAKPSDEQHPFGHGRVEQIITIIMATLLCVTGFELIQSAFGKIFNPEPFETNWIFTIILASTIFVKAGLGKLTLKYADEYDSDTLKADAWHHNTDAISTILVVLALVLAEFGIFIVDGIIGVLIGFYIFYIAFEIAKNSVNHIMGEAVPEGVVEKINALGQKIDAIKFVHGIIYHDYGSSRHVSLDIGVDENMSLAKSHTVADQFSSLILTELGIHSTIHVDPVMPKTESFEKIEKILEAYFDLKPDKHSFRDLRIEEKNEALEISFEIQLGGGLSEDEMEALKTEAKKFIRKLAPEVTKIHISISPLFSLN